MFKSIFAVPKMIKNWHIEVKQNHAFFIKYYAIFIFKAINDKKLHRNRNLHYLGRKLRMYLGGRKGRGRVRLLQLL